MDAAFFVTHPRPGPLKRLALRGQIGQHRCTDALRLQNRAIAVGQTITGPLDALRIVQQSCLLLLKHAAATVKVGRIVQRDDGVVRLPADAMEFLPQALQFGLVAVQPIGERRSLDSVRLADLQADLLQLYGANDLTNECIL